MSETLGLIPSSPNTGCGGACPASQHLEGEAGRSEVQGHSQLCRPKLLEGMSSKIKEFLCPQCGFCSDISFQSSCKDSVLSPSEAPEKLSVAASFPPKTKKEEASHNGQIQFYRVSCVFENQPIPSLLPDPQNS